jgi:protease IV
MSIVVNQDNPSNKPVRIVLEQGGFLGRFGAKLPWILFFFAVVAAFSYYNKYKEYSTPDPQIEEKLVSGDAMAPNKVAIIRVEGTIMHDDGFPKWQIDKAMKDKAVKAVVLRVDSPGGTVTGSDYLHHHLTKLRDGNKDNDIAPKPLVVSMGGIAASGGYYIACAAGPTPDTIFAERSTWTGSIGVIIPHYNVSELLQKWNIKDDSIMSGKLKAMGSPTRVVSPELAEEERKILQELVDQTFGQFKEIVTAARPKLAGEDNAGALKDATTGQIFTAKQALDLGLVDKIGYLEDAIDRAMQLANLSKTDTRIVKYTQPQGLAALFGASAQSGNLELSALLDLAAPRAYYLCSWLPAVVANQSR